MKKFKFITLFVFIISIFAVFSVNAQESDAKGQFKGDCFLSGISTEDPIVKPMMGHMHTFFGNKSVPIDPTVDTVEELRLQSSTAELYMDERIQGSTICDRPDNKSSYWTPEIYINSEPVYPKRLGAYYSSKSGLNPAKTNTMPFGIRMIAKHPTMLREVSGDVSEAAEIDWSCTALDHNPLPDGKTVNPPAEPDPNCYLGVAITYPECVDMNTLNQSPARIFKAKGTYGHDGARSCPTGTKQIPTLQMFIDYGPVNYNGRASIEVAGMDAVEGDMRLPIGNYHADYFNAEDLTDLTTFCINGENAGDTKCMNQRKVVSLEERRNKKRR